MQRKLPEIYGIPEKFSIDAEAKAVFCSKSPLSNPHDFYLLKVSVFR